MATVSTKMVLDTTGFNRGIKSAESSMSKFKSMAGTAAMAGIAAGFAAATAAAAGLAVGIKNVLDIGGALSDLSSRTGVAAGELRVLQEAFKQNGLSADQVGATINKMQRALVEAGQKGGETARAFDTLGLNLDGLRAMSSADQLQTIGQAIAALPDPAARAAAAMQIFGRSGGELLTLFSNSGALSDAATTIGSQADLLTKNANMFDRASDILNSVGAKLEGFFVGVADQVVPAIMPLLEAANSIDLASIGQSLGEGIAFALTAITSGQIGNLLTAQLKLSGAEFINTLVKGIYGIVGFLAQRMVDIPGEFVTLLGIVTKAEFWQGVGNGLLGAAQKFAAIINRAAASLLETFAKVTGFGGGAAANLRDTADRLDASANQNLGEAGDLLSGPLAEARDRISTSFTNAIEAAAVAMEAAGETIDTSGLEAARDGIVNTISEQMKANEEAARARFEATKTATPLFDGDELGKKVRDQVGVITDSLQKVGGGGQFARFNSTASPELDESKKQTGFLSKISEGIYQWIATSTGLQEIQTPTPADPQTITQPLMPQQPAALLPELKPPTATFPNVTGISDVAALHLREAQKQTGLLSRIAEKLAPQPMALMPA
jgi:hypothetical protein